MIIGMVVIVLTYCGQDGIGGSAKLKNKRSALAEIGLVIGYRIRIAM